ncbi:MAG TPA: STAS domain-containing protein [Thermoanaerobaculia bacterium]|nr:STAS domain-containing protein [Thermoanaerobaculia bacterium]
MALSIDIQRPGDALWTARVTLAGSLDGTTAPRLEEALKPLLGAVRHVVFDLADLKFISSAGIRVLLAARKELKARDGSFAMHRLQPQIVKVFEIIGALPGFDIFTSEKELDDYLAAMQRKHASPGVL